MEQLLPALISAVAALIGSAIGAAVALPVGLRQGAASRISAEAARASSAADRKIGEMRMDWLRDLRSRLAKYLSHLLDPTKSQNDRETLELRADLRLMLNISEPGHKKLWDLAEKVYLEPNRPARAPLAEPVMVAGRDVLKDTWDRIKDEVRGTAH